MGVLCIPSKILKSPMTCNDCCTTSLWAEGSVIFQVLSDELNSQNSCKVEVQRASCRMDNRDFPKGKATKRRGVYARTKERREERCAVEEDARLQVLAYGEGGRERETKVCV